MELISDVLKIIDDNSESILNLLSIAASLVSIRVIVEKYLLKTTIDKKLMMTTSEQAITETVEGILLSLLLFALGILFELAVVRSANSGNLSEKLYLAGIILLVIEIFITIFSCLTLVFKGKYIFKVFVVGIVICICYLIVKNLLVAVVVTAIFLCLVYKERDWIINKCGQVINECRLFIDKCSGLFSEDMMDLFSGEINGSEVYSMIAFGIYIFGLFLLAEGSDAKDKYMNIFWVYFILIGLNILILGYKQKKFCLYYEEKTGCWNE
ncbi:MAG: hypothetical protein LUE23_08815 [Lachnospiraceae bacterium]|nr:hypothetical protein [Lachnospiraceae bacterium]